MLCGNHIDRSLILNEYVKLNVARLNNFRMMDSALLHSSHLSLTVVGLGRLVEQLFKS